MIYILDKTGTPLMPTQRHGKIRRMLKNGEAKVIKQIPFTVQILKDTTAFTQPITLGIDSGSQHVGVSATTETQELFSGQHTLRKDVADNLTTRRELRHGRRNRNTRYRKPRFNNRTRTPQNGFDKWFTPTVKTQIQGHEHIIREVKKILPISHIIIECAAFDTQLLQNPNISGVEYQNGEMSDWDANLREYILFRDNYTCQWCKKSSITSKTPVILQTHHIQFRSRGGSNRPGNLITLCTDCHKKLHKIEKETGKLPVDLTKSSSLKSAAHTSTMKWELFNMVKKYDPDANMTFGYKTKKTRITANRNLGLNLPKDHHIDARCITGNPAVTPLGYTYMSYQRRCHDRALCVSNPTAIPEKPNPDGLIKNGGYFRPHIMRVDMHGFRDGDIIEVNGYTYMIKQRQYFPTRATLWAIPWGKNPSEKKISISSNKAKLICRNPDRIEMLYSNEITNENKETIYDTQKCTQAS